MCLRDDISLFTHTHLHSSNYFHTDLLTDSSLTQFHSESHLIIYSIAQLFTHQFVHPPSYLIITLFTSHITNSTTHKRIYQLASSQTGFYRKVSVFDYTIFKNFSFSQFILIRHGTRWNTMKSLKFQWTPSPPSP